MPVLLAALIALAPVTPADAARRRHTVCAVAPIEGVGVFRFCPVTKRR